MDAATTPATERPTRRGRTRWARVRFWLVSVGLGLVAGAAVLAAVTWWLVRSRPTWWTVEAREEAAAAAVGQELENAVVSQLHASRGDAERWAVSISEQDANDWLATRLVKWLMNREEGVDWRAVLEGAEVRFDRGEVMIGASIRSGGGGSGQVVWAALSPRIDGEGKLWLEAQGAWVGRLPIPLSMFQHDGLGVKLLPARVTESKATGTILQALTGEAPLAVDPVASLADGRKVRLLGVKARDGRLELVCRTELSK